MIGWVEFNAGNALVAAILSNNGVWICDGAPRVADELNRECAPVGDPADDTWGHDALVKAAVRLRGLAWLGPGPQGDDPATPVP